MSARSRLFRVNLGAELRTLRERAEMSTRTVATRLGTSPAWVSRTETGARYPTPEEVAALCDLYGATGEMHDLLTAKAESNDGTTINLPSHDQFADQLANIMLLETEARRVTTCEIALVPGLLQTAEYARQMISTVNRPQSEIERRVATRIGRQAVLSRPNGPELRFLIDEFVLRRRIGGVRTMRGQLQKIMADSECPNVRVRVIPASAGAHPGLDGTFAIYEFAALETYVYLENRKGGIFVTDGNATQQYVESRDALWEAALGENESVELIDALVEGLIDD
ncbi:helix-turn-helix transcriptional regulator [Saccharopolyspora sp. TS4A08]|uniref:Helix-turn-helix transcriptional regulator n=1 Tax=Saccharopolyspora ipomoeae TaxID=3042027 RepID=A0ABT6PQW3_9PSEU|nr:helix-turn-helix transcriptional regulator [Saccharopolyspora sp. TS4A08]MDI2030053.1 helix-turn-helix transcriptional regulator [Saccharopolyspora sp. TS4A08]